MSATQYYYLDSEKKIRGPFTAEHMKALVIAGTINMQTMVAIAGDDNWKPLETQEWVKDGQVQTEAGQVPSFTAGVGGVDPGACPYCGHELTGWTVPTHCPNCGKQLAPVKDTIRSNMAFGLCRFFTLRGRATRKEFWSMILLGSIVNVFIFVALIVALTVYIVELLKVHEDTPVETFMPNLISTLPALLMYVVIISFVLNIPYYFVVSRRLHDIGYSAKWVLLTLAVSVLYQGVYFSGLDHQMQQMGRETTTYMENVARVTNDCVTELGLTDEQRAAEDFEVDIEEQGNVSIVTVSTDDRKASREIPLPDTLNEQKLENRMNLPYPANSGMGITCIVLQLASSLLGLFLFVVAFIDSKRGPNKYGPSIKYPRG